MNPPRPIFAPGSLWALARARKTAALASGALQPIETTSTVVEDAGLRFNVRVVGSLCRKDEVRRALTGEGRGDGLRANPFLPYDAALHVADVSSEHTCLLNKFPVIDDHLLIVTREFRHQEELLDGSDFAALWRCLREGPALGFYNGGEEAGASQPHKHLQLVPLPLAPETPELPVEPLLRPALAAGGLVTVPGLPFEHLAAAVTSETEAHAAYRAGLEQLGLARSESTRQRAPYNLLVTPSWMLLVPRSVELALGISCNALGFAGGLLLRNQQQLDEVRRLGPMALLKLVTK